MKALQDAYFIAKYFNGGELGDRCETLEAMREAIDKANEHNKVYGYQQHRHIICKYNGAKSTTTTVYSYLHTVSKRV